MSRELDWKIHTLMGNDLTGWEWYEDHEDDNEICKREANGWVEHFDRIPHYSTTWEGAGLVMEWLIKEKTIFSLSTMDRTGTYVAKVGSGWTFALDQSGPLALAKAYISAMDSRQ